MSDAAVHVIVGRVRKAHGIRGELVVEPMTDEPDAIFASGRRLYVGDALGRPDPKVAPVEVERAQPFKGGYILTVTGIPDRTAAERWRERYFLLPEEELPPPSEDEIYLHDLPGMRVELEDGAVVGVVSAVFELPQGLVLDVARGGDAGAKPSTVMIPYDERTVVGVDREERRVVVALPDGLLD
ncbi:MAG TPA: ribosome maturation factor RimM [Gemmatimonadaceae bacterium]|nr:ribosome maturation factor RimM [Gemmatimonadaceae bacterium]